MGLCGDWNFQESLYVTDRGVLTLLLYEDSPYIASPPFSNFVQHPLFSITSNPQPPLLFLLPFFFGWMGDHVTYDIQFYLMIIWIYTCQALVPYYQKDLDVCLMQQGIRFTEVWHIMLFFTGTLIWYYTHKNTQTHTAHSGASRLTNPYKYIFPPPIMYSQQLPLLND